VETIIANLRTNKAAKTGISVVSVVLLLGAVALLGWPFFTNLYQSRLQSRLVKQLADPALAQEFRNHNVPVGFSLTRLQIPAIGVDTIVVEGTSEEALRAGAGHYTGTPLPCEVGDVAIAGHRTTYGRPFSDVDRLKVGDRIILSTPIGTCTYEVDRPPFVVLPSDTWVVAPTPGRATLTLTSCTPKGSASHRIIIKAVMVQTATAA